VSYLDTYAAERSWNYFSGEMLICEVGIREVGVVGGIGCVACVGSSMHSCRGGIGFIEIGVRKSEE
jgi:hypothetical protein